MNPEKRGKMSSNSFFKTKKKKKIANEQSFSKPDVLLFISKRIKHNKKLAKKGVRMGYGGTCVKK